MSVKKKSDLPDLEAEAEAALSLRTHADEDPALVRWVALLTLEGLSIPEIKQRLVETSLVHSRVSKKRMDRLMRLASQESAELRSMVKAKAELSDQTWMRLESYMRRKRVIDLMEELCVDAVGKADSVGQLNQVAFMLAQLQKAQDSMDAFTGSKAPPVSVVAHVSYDPLEQMRNVIQKEVIETEFTVVETTEEEPAEDAE